MIYYFQKGLKPCIKVEMKQQDWESVSFKEIMQRVINVEAKVGLKSSIMIQDSDICYPRGHCSSNNTVTKILT